MFADMHLVIKLLLALGLLLFTASAERHLFTSTAHIAQLSSAKQQLADALQGFADNETLRLHRVRHFAESLRNSAPAAVESALHPVEAFRTIRRMGEEWKRLLGDCGHAADSVLRSVGVELPTSGDYDGAADALLRLQDVYGISADSMARGRLVAGSSGTKNKSSDPLLLSANDCLHLVSRAFNQSHELLGIEWIRLLMSDTFSAEERVESLETVLNILQKSMALKSQNFIGSTLDQLWHQVKGNVTKFVDDISLRTEEAKDMQNYKKLCKDGSFPRPSASSSHLVCRLSVPHPFFTLAPVKEELLNEEPRVLFFYDVLTDAESSRLIQVSDPNLRRGMISSGYSNMRIAMISFMFDKQDWSIQRVNRRLGALTGLNISDSDPLQMGNYGIGGQYEPHRDSFGSGLAYGNNRISTVLLYLNDVKQGGGTVFPRLGLRVPPVRNGALFWHNLRRNSAEISDTTHAGCPVLEGSKWVSNKWIYYLGQMHHRPCGLQQSQ